MVIQFFLHYDHIHLYMMHAYTAESSSSVESPKSNNESYPILRSQQGWKDIILFLQWHCAINMRFIGILKITQK